MTLETTTITGLPNATTPLDGSERVPMDQDGTTVDATTQAIADLAAGTDLSYTQSTRTLASSTGEDVVLPLATDELDGLMSAAHRALTAALAAAGVTVEGSAVVIPHIHGTIAGNVYIHVRNTSGAPLAAGTAVYVTGSVGDTDRLTVAACDPTDTAKMPAVGVLETTLANNGDGNAIILGELRPFNTEAFSLNQALYVAAGGQLTGSVPTSGIVQAVGTVARVQSNTGTIVVHIGDRLGTAALRAVGTGAGTVAAGDDARFTDARTPTEHKSTHATGGSDALSPADIGAEVAGAASSAVSTHVGQADPHTQYALEANLAAVATSGAYGDLSGRPTLGTAAAAATTDFAPASQGVTNGNSHDHSGGDGAQIAYGSLSGLPSIPAPADAVPLAPGTAAVGTSTDYAREDHVHPLPGLVTSSTAGLVPATGGGTTTFLRADGTFAEPPGGAPGGSSGQLQFNNDGVFGGLSTSSIDGSGNMTFSGRWINSRNSEAAAPAKTLTGTWFTGGTSTTTKPHFLIEPAGTTSTAWSTAGTGLGVNAPSGFAGDLAWLGVNGTNRFRVDSAGNVNAVNVTASASVISLVQTFTSNCYSTFVRVPTSGSYSWSNAVFANSTADLVLVRDAANILAQRNDASAQAFRLYNTFTSATNFERLNVRWTSNEAILDTEAGSGGGTLRGLKIGSAATSLLGFYGATPVDQPAAVADATDAPSVITQLNLALARLRELGLIAT